MKRKLLFAAMLAIAGAFSLNVQAQKDVTSQYITNATLSSLTGWTNVNFNTPVRGNNTEGYASECYAGWGSLEKDNYSLKQTITLPAGHYTLVNYSFFRYGLNADTDASKSLAYLVAGSQSVAIKTLGSITASGYANSQAEGANCFDSKMYRNTLDFTIDADNTSIEIGLQGTFDLKQSWIIAGMFELINNDILATIDAPFDVTGYITNPGFEYRDMSGWTLSPSGYFGTQSNNQGFKVGGYYAEKWQASGALPEGNMSQTIANLPAGYYKLTANLGGNGTYIDLNGKTANWTADGNYTVGYVLGDNENLVITAGKTEEGTANWIHFDNFKLQFCGDVQESLETLCAQVSSYDGLIPTAAYTQLQSDVDALDQTYTDVDELLQAIDDVQALYDAADLLKAPYADWLTAKSAAQTNYSAINTLISAQSTIVENSTVAGTITAATTELTAAETNYDAWAELKTLADALVLVPNDNAEANSTFSSAISTQNTTVTSATIAASIATATASLKDAMVTYVGTANPTQGNRFNLTFMVTNPSLDDFAAWTSVDDVDGWYSDQEDGNRNTQKSDGVACVKGNAFFEYWSATAKANNEYSLYNKVQDLPEGTYTIECYALAAANGVEEATTSKVYFYANDTQGSLVSSDVLSQASISFINDATQDVKIGLKPLAGNQFRWMGIGYIELYKEYTDNTTYDITTTIENGTVAVSVDGETATSAKALKTVTLTVTPDAGCVLTGVTATYGESTSLDVANPSTNVYTFQMPAADVAVNVAIIVDKTALNEAIDAANALVNKNVGAGVFQIPASANSALATAITNASAASTVAEVAAQTSALNTAINVFKAAELNAPAADTRYYLNVATVGHSKFGNAIVVSLGTPSDNNPTGYGFAASASPVAYKAQAFIFTKVEGKTNTYNISVERPEGVVYLTYGALNGSAAGWKNQQIQGTTVAENKGEFQIFATTTDNVFNIYNTIDNNFIDCQDGGSLYTDTNIDMDDFTLTVAPEAEVAVSVKAGKYATRIFPFVPENISGVDYYAVNAIEGSYVSLTKVETPAANVPYILKNTTESDIATTQSGYGMAVEDSYTEGELVGVYTTATIPEGSYVLQTQNDVQGFYEVEGAFTATAYRVYMKAQSSGAKAIFFDFGDATGINGVVESKNLLEGTVYDLSGRKVENPTRGLYIINGKKVMLK